ncbi:hypothetical protein EEL49_01165 [Muribaculaceae bacterium Isolate-104 (HZI)]|nr:hypothetical protein EEL49_01165 [Muribaculaceae bacterium Isolate-104 (HZI)]
MKNISKNNWALWVLMASVFMMMALAAREVAVEKDFESLYANVVFVSTFSILISLYAIIIDILTPVFDWAFKRMGFKAKTKIESTKAKNNDNLVIDYATTRDKTLKKQEQRILAIEKKVITYVGDVMSPYLSKGDLSILIENVISFIHLNFAPNFDASVSVKISRVLTTADLMHFGWNIAKPFRKPGAHTALFLKQVFADAFRNTELQTIERKLRNNPMTGTIKINPDICGCKRSEEVQKEGKPATSKMQKSKSESMSTKECALTDMNDDLAMMSCEVEDNIEDDEDAA